MCRHVFNRIVRELQAHDPYFVQQRDVVGKLRLSALQKCTAAVRMLTYGVAGDLIDEHLRMGESTCLKAM
jgi:hypothetical protein